MAPNPNLGVLQSFVTAVFSGDSDALKSHCHQDFELHEGSGFPFAGTYRGGDGFLTFLARFNDTFDIARLETTRTYVGDDPDYVVCEMEIEATVRSTGKAFISSLLERWHFRDGKVLNVKPHYFNAL